MNVRVWRLAVVLGFTLALPAFGQWVKTYGGPGNEYGYAQPTSDGGYIVVGSTSSFGAANDAWLLKLDAVGAPEWQRTLGGPASDAASCVQQTADGGFLVVGSTSSFGAGLSDVWVFKLSAAGDLVWQRTYGGSANDSAVALALTAAGEAYVAANTESFSYATRARDFWVLKISSNGDIIWQRQYGGYTTDFCANLEPTTDGGCIVSGTGYGFEPPGPPYPASNPSILKLAPNGDIQWQKRLGHDLFFYNGGWQALRQTTDGGYVVTGHTSSSGQGSTDLYVAKLQPNGDLAWIKTYGTARSEFNGPIVQTQDGGFAVIAGTGWIYQYGEDLFLLKLSAAGDIQWQRGFGGSLLESAAGLHQLSDGKFVFCGWTESFGAGGRDILLVKTSPDGYIDPACPNEAPFIALVGQPYCLVQTTARTPLDTDCVVLVSSATSAVTSATPFTQCSAMTYTLTIAAAAGGTTSPAPGSYTYDEGTSVSVQALPATAYQFDNWTGDASGSTNPLTVVMNADRSIQANFSRVVKPPLDLSGERLANRAVSMVEYVVRLKWQANPANTETIGFRIYRIENNQATAIADVAAGTSEYIVRRLQRTTAYRFGVTAVNSQGWESDMVEVTVQ